MRNVVFGRRAIAACVMLAAAQMPAVAVAQQSPKSSWTGFYVGGHVGFAGGGADWLYQGISPFSATNGAGPITMPGESFSFDSTFAGLQIGAGYQVGRWVVGAEVSYSDLALSETRPVSPGAFATPATATVHTDIDSTLVVAGRVGYLVLDQLLVYGKGGFARSDVSVSGSESTATYTFAASKQLSGWSIGGGVELRLNSALSIGLEYARLDLGDHKLAAPIATLPAFPADMRVSPEIDTITLRLNARLGQ